MGTGEAVVSGIVLAGGASSRMGFNKALAKMVDGATLLDRTLEIVRRLAAEVIVVTKNAQSYDGLAARVVDDIYPGAGALGGIYTGLVAAQHEHAMVVACDMPFLNVPLWQYMLGLPRDYEVLMPRCEGLYEPLHAIYGKSCKEAIKGLLDQGRLRVTSFLPYVKVKFIEDEQIDQFDPEHHSFCNVNTPVELERALAQLRRQK